MSRPRFSLEDGIQLIHFIFTTFRRASNQAIRLCLLMTTTISYASSQVHVPEHTSFQQSLVLALPARSLDHSLKISVHWEYNIHQHLRAQHPSWEANVLQGRELQEFRDKIMITDEEETKSRILEDQRGWYRPGISDLSDMRHTHTRRSSHPFAMDTASRRLSSMIKTRTDSECSIRSTYLSAGVLKFK